MGLGFSLALGALFFVGALGIQLRSAEKLSGAEIGAFADGDETIVNPAGRDSCAGVWRLARLDYLETEEVGSGDAKRAIRAGLRLGIYTKESDPE